MSGMQCVKYNMNMYIDNHRYEHVFGLAYLYLSASMCVCIYIYMYICTHMSTERAHMLPRSQGAAFLFPNRIVVSWRFILAGNLLYHPN